MENIKIKCNCKAAVILSEAAYRALNKNDINPLLT
jgi:hypothetical protein